MYIFIRSLYTYYCSLYGKKCTKISLAQLFAQGISILYILIMFTVKVTLQRRLGAM